MSPKAPPARFGIGWKVDLVAAEIEQLLVDDRETRLTAGLHRDPRQQLGNQHQLGLVAPDDLRHREILRIADLGHHVVRRLAPRRAVGDRQQSLDRVGVGVDAGSRQQDDAPAALDVHHLEIGHVGRVARAADDARRAGVADALAQRLLHLDLVAVAEHHHRGAALVGVGDRELRDDREHARRPAEDERVPAFEHARATLAELGHLLFDGAGQRADERADDEDAAQRDRQHREQEPPAAGVAAHGP
jgi:hypothetical protein